MSHDAIPLHSQNLKTNNEVMRNAHRGHLANLQLRLIESFIEVMVDGHTIVRNNAE